MGKAVVIGSLNYDIFLSLASVPRIGETANALSSNSCAGGKGANQAVQLAKLGTSVCMVGSIGNDRMGAAVKDSLLCSGVDCGCLKCSPDAETGMGIVDVFPDGSVMAVISHGANYRMTADDIRCVREKIRKSDLVVLQLEIPMEVVKYAIDLAKEYGVRVLLNAAPAAKLEDAYIRKCDYFVVNEVEASFYAGEETDTPKKAEKLIRKMAQKYGNCWICTLGKHGALIVKGRECRMIPAVATSVVETTGAGDSFVGGFSYGILEGMDEFAAGQFAAHCSAVTIRNVGAQASMPVREQIRQEFGL